MYGLLLFIFLRFERPQKSPTRTLSPNFISVGESVAMPASRRPANDRNAAGNDAGPSPSGASAS
jgi:hypothetical protein